MTFVGKTTIHKELQRLAAFVAYQEVCADKRGNRDSLSERLGQYINTIQNKHFTI
jgi:hypothetical protein